MVVGTVVVLGTAVVGTAAVVVKITAAEVVTEERAAGATVLVPAAGIVVVAAEEATGVVAAAIVEGTFVVVVARRVGVRIVVAAGPVDTGMGTVAEEVATAGTAEVLDDLVEGVGGALGAEDSAMVLEVGCVDAAGGMVGALELVLDDPGFGGGELGGEIGEDGFCCTPGVSACETLNVGTGTGTDVAEDAE